MTHSFNTNSTTSRPPCQLYLITPQHVPDVAAFVGQLEQALAGGPVAALQLRLKLDGVAATDEDILALARAVKPLLDVHDVALILNDRPDLVSMCQADGVHVGQGDASVAAARKLVAADIQIGVTCHDSRHLAMEAGEAGADYVAFGAFFPTRTKVTTAIPAPEIITWWTNLTEIPCVAIGGITSENAAPLIAAGADFIAVSSGVWNHSQGPKQAVMEFNQLF
jgi:thiamine-phosphate pyrophosphorylase